MTDIENIAVFHQCLARYMPDAYVDYETACGKKFGHVGEHVTKFKVPDVLGDGETRKIFWDDRITTKLNDDGTGIYATCTCGWRSDPTSLLADIASEAFAHAEETEHLLRKHTE